MKIKRHCIYCGRDYAYMTVPGGQAHRGCVKPERVEAAVRAALNDETSPTDESGQSAGFSVGPL